VAHIPVLQKEVLQYLDPKANENFIDCTLGLAGHTLAILERNSPKGKILGIDADQEVIKNLKLKIKNFSKRIILIADNFVNLKEIVRKEKFAGVHGILFDLGLSSWDLEESGRGFSFKKNEPLDMRYSLQNKFPAEKIVNYWSKFDIEKILRDYGEERKAGYIAQEIIEKRKIRPIKTTWQLREIISRTGVHPQRSFQALRIAVNDELNNLEKALPQAVEILKPGGRLVVISFHSLEDRIVKNFYKSRMLSPKKRGEAENEANLQTPSVNLKILTKKPVTPTAEEIKINPRSRSAKLRAAEKLPTKL